MRAFFDVVTVVGVTENASDGVTRGAVVFVGGVTVEAVGFPAEGAPPLVVVFDDPDEP
jgi:hypothetical protein